MRRNLTDVDVEAIRSAIVSCRYASLAQIARVFGVTRSDVSRIGHGHRWAEAGGETAARFRDRIQKPRHRASSTLTEDEVLQIKKRLICGDVPCELAAEFAISQTTIHGIASGNIWRGVQVYPGAPIDRIPIRSRYVRRRDQAEVLARSSAGEPDVELAAAFLVTVRALEDLRTRAGVAAELRLQRLEQRAQRESERQRLRRHKQQQRADASAGSLKGRISRPRPTRLTRAQVQDIRERLLAGARGKNLALEFGVSPQLISDIKRGRIYGASDERLASHNASYKLNASQVADIRAQLADGVDPTALAAQFGVTRQNIVRIGKRKTWRSDSSL